MAGVEPRGGDRSGTFAGPYAFVRPIGTGGMGEVWLGRHEHLQRDVALKVVRQDRIDDATVRARFVQEARLASSVVHPYVATVFDVVDDGDDTVLVMEYVQGRDLRAILPAEAGVPLEERIRYGIEITEALEAIHDRGLLHRDLKPGNVIVTPSGHVKVLDFGLARKTRPILDGTSPVELSETSFLSLTQPGRVVGTVSYMSPEQIRGQALDTRSDLFSLGVLLWELFTSRHPFLRNSIEQTVTAILEEEPLGRSVPGVPIPPPALQPVLARALSKSRDARYRTAGELADDLRAVARGEAARTVPGARPRRMLGLAAILAILLLAGVSATARWLRTPPVWNAPRIAVAFVALEDRTGLPDGSVRASMVADLVATDLAGSRIVRAIGPDQTGPIVSGLPSPASWSDVVRRVASALAVDYVVTGSLYLEGDRFIATVETTPTRDGPSLASLRAEGPTAVAVAEALARSIRRSLPGVSALHAIRDDRTDLAALTSASEEARLLYERGTLAWRDGNLREASDFLGKAVSADPRFSLARAALAQVKFEEGYARDAREEADRALSTAPDEDTPSAERLRLLLETVRARVSEDSAAFEAAAGRLAERFGDEPEVLALHARALGSAGRTGEALERVGLAISLDSTRPALHLQRAKILSQLERWDDALASIAGAERIYRTLGSREGLANAERARGETFFQAQRYTEGRAALESAIAEFRSLGRPTLAADSERDLASVLILTGRPGEAGSLLASAAATAVEAGQRGLHCRILSSRGAQAYIEGRYRDAETLMREAADEARRLQNDRLLLDPLSNLTNLQLYTGQYAEARTSVEELVATATRSGSREHLGDARLNLAVLDAALGRLDASLETYADILRIEGDSAVTQNAAWARLGRAEVLKVRGPLGDALDEATRGLEIFERLGAPGFAGYGRLGRGQVALELGRIREARQDLERAIEEAGREGAGLDDLAVRASVCLVLVEIEDGNRAAAKRLAARAFRARGADSAALRAWIASAECEYLNRTGDEARAEAACRRAAEDPASLAFDAVAARASRAETLARLENLTEARDEARRAFEAARQAGIPLAGARAAAVLAELPDEMRPDDGSSIRSGGREMLQVYLAGIPATDRDRVSRRARIARLARLLDAAPENDRSVPSQPG